MRQTVQSLEQFYSSSLGKAAQAMIGRRLLALWPDLRNLDVLGYGYALPHLKPYSDGAHRLINAMPAEQGAARFVCDRGNCSVLTLDHYLPFAPSIFDRVLVVHGMEEAPRLDALLEELWRVMKPEGRIVIITANRSGFWARSDKTPFGAGRPFTRSQLSKVLRSSGFVPSAHAGALYCPPIKSLCNSRLMNSVEKFGETVWPGFSGLVLVEAVKRLYAGRAAKEKYSFRRPSLVRAGALGTSIDALMVKKRRNKGDGHG